MAFIRYKKIKGNRYYYLVQSKRVNGRVMQKVLAYYGVRRPPALKVAVRKKRKLTAKKKKSK